MFGHNNHIYHSAKHYQLEMAIPNEILDSLLSELKKPDNINLDKKQEFFNMNI